MDARDSWVLGCDVCYTICCGTSHFRSSSQWKTLKAVMFVESFALLITQSFSTPFLFYGFPALGIKWFEVHLSRLSCRYSEDTNVDANHPQGDCCLMCVGVENRLVLYMEKSKRHQSPCSQICTELRAELPRRASIFALAITNHEGVKACPRKVKRRTHTHTLTSVGSHLTHIIHRSPSLTFLELRSVNAEVLLIRVCCVFEETLCLSVFYNKSSNP